MQQPILRTVFALFLCCTLAASASAGEGKPAPPKSPPLVWTAEQAVLFALADNPDSHMVARKIEEAEAAGPRWPRPPITPRSTWSAEYGQTNNPMYSFGNILNQGAFDDSIDFNSPGRTDNLQLKAEVQYRLYSGGRDTADQQAAAAQA